jgi:hypothetical protein
MSRGDREDDALRSAIEELRSFDERSAPSFDAVLARRRARRAAWSPARVAIAAGIAIVAAGALVQRATSGPEPFTVPREVLALSAWRPITDVLLETPNRALLRETPRFGASLIQTPYMGDSR